MTPSRTTVDDLVFGNVLRSVESLTRAAAAKADPALATAGLEYGLGLLKSGEFPQLTAMYMESVGNAGQPGPSMTGETLTSEFERGLASLLDGIAARMNLA
jgi:hypothetical protein